ncbi:hypothetical protein RhiirA5_369023 [Rhizophagus irregularis]|uniref:Uncharacterized protein n=1 Tax=Rhizophagus irregularis TaxID=588596 RepID=A0A2N0QEJ9_9GLOM|nr:hypothetical protein RhiirA5_369023 [Rhizophagus irregularis]PKC75868.1 hypothetical protein RhiirA1_386967 [Rhizophagus irregularis]
MTVPVIYLQPFKAGSPYKPSHVAFAILVWKHFLPVRSETTKNVKNALTVEQLNKYKHPLGNCGELVPWEAMLGKRLSLRKRVAILKESHQVLEVKPPVATEYDGGGLLKILSKASKNSADIGDTVAIRILKEKVFVKKKNNTDFRPFIINHHYKQPRV